MNKITDNPRNVTKPLNICSDFHLDRHFFGLVEGFFVGLFVTLEEIAIFLCIKAVRRIGKNWGYDLETVLNSTFCYELHSMRSNLFASLVEELRL